jgi:hypothetical protein
MRFEEENDETSVPYCPCLLVCYPGACSGVVHFYKIAMNGKNFSGKFEKL